MPKTLPQTPCLVLGRPGQFEFPPSSIIPGVLLEAGF